MLPRTDFTLDWIWLSLQAVILSTVMVRELIRPQRRNLYAFMYPGALLVLVQGQAWWMLSAFEQIGTKSIRHLYQTISLEGARLANFYVGLCVIAFGITYAFLAPRKTLLPRPELPRLRIPILLYAMVVPAVVAASMLLLRALGGLATVLTNPGLTIVGGSTLYLLLIGLGRFPLLHKLTLRQKGNALDLMIFTGVLFMFLINTRILTAFIVLELALILNYCWREVSRRMLLALAFAMFLLFIVWGLYREYAARNDEVDLAGLQSFFATRTGDQNPLEWFYRMNVEGFAGLAGLLTFEDRQGGLAHDFGLSNLRVITQFVPYAIRNDPDLPIREWSVYFNSLYPYKGSYQLATELLERGAAEGTVVMSGSVVPSGMENAYAHFGLPGVLALGVLLGFLTRWLHLRMLSPRSDRLYIAMLSVQFMQLIRGSFYHVLLYSLVATMLVVVYRSMLWTARGFTRVRAHRPQATLSIQQ